MKRAIGVLLRVVGLLVALPLALLAGVNVFINVWVPVMVNHQPERTRLGFEVAWMIVPGVIEMRGLELRQQSRMDQWVMHVDRVTGSLSLQDLRDHVIHITAAEGHGASFLWRPRVDAPAPVVPPLASPQPIADSVSVAPDFGPPIPGLTNPPTVPPEAIYPAPNPWRIVLDDIRVEQVRELWLGDYRYDGDATVSGSLTLQARKWLQVDGATLQLKGGALTRGGAPMLTGLTGTVGVQVVGGNAWTGEGRSVFNSLSGDATLTADVANLAFLEFYLQSAPWLHLSGGDGRLDIAVRVLDGEFQPGSTVSADVHNIVAQFLSYTIVGDGQVRVGVDAASGAPLTTLDVQFLDFVVNHEGDSTPHATGRGFRVLATTPDVALDRPFTSLDVRLDLPEAAIPDVGVYNTYIPKGTGLALRTGTGTVRGSVEISTLQGDCHGELFIDGHGLQGTLDNLILSGDIGVHAIVPRGNVAAGEYDISGSSFDLHSVRVLSGGSQRAGKDDSRGWWAELKVPDGHVAVGAPTFLDGALRVKARDTIPFITIFSAKEGLPGWVRGMLAVRPVAGSVRLRVGDEVLRLSDFHLDAGAFSLQMELRRRKEMEGKLLAEYGKLAVGMAMNHGASQFHVFNARGWYADEPDPR